MLLNLHDAKLSPAALVPSQTDGSMAPAPSKKYPFFLVWEM